MSCGVGCRCSLNPALLWLWHMLAAVALIRPLAWELSDALGAALKRLKDQKQTNKKTGFGVPVVAKWLTNPTRNREVEGSIPGLAQCVKDPVLL